MSKKAHNRKARSEKSLERKLQHITGGDYTPEDFIIADAKDGDMAFGTQAPAPRENQPYRRRQDHLDDIATMTASGLVDVMLMSASNAELLSEQGIFERTPVTPAVRMNDTTDIWMARGGCYRDHPSMPFASSDLEAVSSFCSLGLYSMTFSNRIDCDLASLEAYKAFRQSIRGSGFRHFLEVFNPAFDIGIASEELGFYVNDMIMKALAGVTRVDRPLFLKIQFNGRRAMEELSSYDPENLVVGILGGARGTTRDCFELACQAEEAGARVALFGRKINFAEAPLELLRLLRACLERQLSTVEAVGEYHDFLADNGIPAERSREADLDITDPVLQ